MKNKTEKHRQPSTLTENFFTYSELGVENGNVNKRQPNRKG